MPHIMLEYSSNILDEVDANALNHIHNTMMKTGHFQFQDIKIRTLPYDNFLVSDGKKNQAFIHLQVSIKPRGDDIKRNLSNSLLEVLEGIFVLTKQEKNVSFTVEIRELHVESYSKAIYGSL